MTTHNTQDSSTLEGPCSQPGVVTLLDYINPEGNPFNTDQPLDPDNGHGSDQGDLPGPGGDPDPDDAGDDGPANDPPADNRLEGDHFIEALMALSGSIKDLCQNPTPKPEKIKV